MNLVPIISSNFIINVAVTSWFLAQLLKLIFTLLLTQKLQLERMFGSGGMPSSHSALACSVAVAMARKLGFSSPVFGLAFCFAAIVIYDAMGVRRAAGEQAKVLNKMIFDFPFFKQKHREDGNEPTSPEDDSVTLIPKELKELLGHTPFEVLGGCILGIAVALLMPMV
ncbi:MAG: divergent PAP2 family protein [Oscillospiraceae bacterium]|nr:divergent PAP2 family protein [Oscillospiraceae bacterium]